MKLIKKGITKEQWRGKTSCINCLSELEVELNDCYISRRIKSIDDEMNASVGFKCCFCDEWNWTPLMISVVPTSFGKKLRVFKS